MWKLASEERPLQLRRLLHSVVGGFLGDDYVVDVGFAEAGGGDTDELAFFGELVQGAGADVAHAAIGLEGASLIETRFAGGLSGAGKKGPDNDAGSAGSDGLGDVTGIFD